MTLPFALSCESAIRQLDERAYETGRDDAAQYIASLTGEQGAARLGLLRLARTRDDLPAVTQAAEAIRSSCASVVVFGTGGSSLGGQSLSSLAKDALGRPTSGPALYFYDNVDPYTLDSLERCLNLPETGFVVISKSGTTMETAAQFLMLVAWLEARGARQALKERIWVVTDAGPNPLRDLAESLGCMVLDCFPGVGGRYSVLTVVGMLPAAIAGLDIYALRDGAEAVAQACEQHPAEALPVVGAALNSALLDQGYLNAAMMPYCDRLARFSAWYKQLVGESLGKNGLGITPLTALGTVDQHSQLQLYLDGPKDKHFTLVHVDSRGKGPKLAPVGPQHEALSYLNGKAIGDVLDAEFQATAETLMQNGCPVRIVTLPELTPYSYGAVLMHYMIETILTGKLMAVDPFDQPAVDQGKRIARDLLRGMAAAA